MEIKANQFEASTNERGLAYASPKMECKVTLHCGDGDGKDHVVTAYPGNQQAEAFALWQRYVADGKLATLTNY
ncbi:hypothetical protein [Pseudomonas fluorescens]|uniref:hypothetical protein n=1 Tax=Pseudomonas fluorescens TaxID=294 RepID=UPI0010D47949|nr:hypothetical protein [Pseudomonas fluorescens]TCV62769.1 hypothetical protein EDB98_11277 [Pseudomonas fluorescens]